MAKKNRLILLDAHAIIHRAYHALPDFSNSKGEPTGALYGISAMLMKIVADLKPDYIVACYDLPQKTFRHEAYEGYKGTRAKTDDNLIAQIISSRKIFEAFNIPMYDAAGFEADDILGTIVDQVKKEKMNLDIVIASGDMDTLQLVDGKHVQVFTLKKGINDTVQYDEDAVKARFGFPPKLLPDYKGLRGDPSDNIIGIAGIGEKTATDLICNLGSIEDIYKKIKKDESAVLAIVKPRILELLKNGEEEALFSKTLATIRRDAPIAFHTPEKNFKEAIDIPKIETLFRELEFRGLIARVSTLFGVSKSADDTSGSQQEAPVDTNPDETKRLTLALWLLNSDMNNLGFDDVVHYAGAKTFAEGKEKILSDIKEKGLSYVYEDIELPILPIIEKMEKVDRSFCIVWLRCKHVHV